MESDDTAEIKATCSAFDISGDDVFAPGSFFEGRYEILSLLGRGVSGTVYKARHLALSQLVAIKMINRQLLGTEIAVKRFQNEAMLLSSFEHPNIVRFKAYGCSLTGRFYTVLEYLDGRTLAQILAGSTRLSVKQALPLLLDITRGIAYAHEKGIVHRDIKPANIMVLSGASTAAGHAKIMDFGIFKDVEARSQALTADGQFLGSADYMSPEQCKGTQIDKRSDVYSLGCLIFETLCGAPPMRGETDLLTMSNHLNQKVRSVPVAGMPADLETIILKCLSKDPAKRFADAGELALALQDVQEVPSRASAVRLALPAVIFVALTVAAVAAYLLVGKRAGSPPPPDRLQLKYSTSLHRQAPPPGADPLDTFLREEEWLSVNVKRQADPSDLAEAWMRADDAAAAISRKANTDSADQIEDALARQIEFDEKVMSSGGVSVNGPRHDKIDKASRLITMLVRRGKYEEARRRIEGLRNRFPAEDEDIPLLRQDLFFRMRILLAESRHNDAEARQALLERAHWHKNEGRLEDAARDYALLSERLAGSGLTSEARKYAREAQKVLASDKKQQKTSKSSR